MYFHEHFPPHFHAYYAESEATFEIETLKILEGKLPKRALAMVLEWAQEHRTELQQNWHLAMSHQPLSLIPPLE